jgi:hypothetical protein
MRTVERDVGDLDSPVPDGNSETSTGPRSTGSRPVTARICAFTASRATSGEIRKVPADSATTPMAITPATRIPRRFKAVAAVTVGQPGTSRKGGRLEPYYRQPARLQT